MGKLHLDLEFTVQYVTIWFEDEVLEAFSTDTAQ
jgi:hypothetical protein